MIDTDVPCEGLPRNDCRARKLALAVDARGNVYTAEVDTGTRVQKFKLTSDAFK